jgi:1-acyl-sn-glycerol-3-phosphate acyltransferase
MIKADHKKWAVLLFDFYIGRLLKNNFGKFLALNELPSIESNHSLLVTPNHFSWWDGFFIDYTFKKLSKRKLHLLMLEEQLKRFWFFKKVGAYSINFSNPKSMAETISYSRMILHNPNNFVVVYPQGEIRPYEERPVKMKEGIRSIVKDTRNKTFVLPAAFKIIYGKDKNPDVHLRFGEMISSEIVRENFSFYSDKFNENLHLLDQSDNTAEGKNLFKL